MKHFFYAVALVATLCAQPVSAPSAGKGGTLAVAPITERQFGFSAAEHGPMVRGRLNYTGVVVNPRGTVAVLNETQMNVARLVVYGIETGIRSPGCFNKSTVAVEAHVVDNSVLSQPPDCLAVPVLDVRGPVGYGLAGPDLDGDIRESATPDRLGPIATHLEWRVPAVRGPALRPSFRPAHLTAIPVASATLLTAARVSKAA